MNVQMYTYANVQMKKMGWRKFKGWRCGWLTCALGLAEV